MILGFEKKNTNKIQIIQLALKKILTILTL